MCFALVAQLVEHTLGKGEVSGSNPLKSSIIEGRYENICLCFKRPRFLAWQCLKPYGVAASERSRIKVLKNFCQVRIMVGLILF